MKIDGVMIIDVSRHDGTTEKIIKHNMIVNSGFDLICEAIGGTTQPKSVSKIQVGSGTSDTTADMTALEAKIAEGEAGYSHTTGTKVFSLSSHFAAGEATGAITEAGVFNADGVMLDRVTFKVANIDEDDEITVNFQFTLS